MLKAIVNELNIESAKGVIQEYSDAIEEFSKTEVRNCLHDRFSYASPLQCERITIVVDRNTDDCTLDDVRILSANIFHKLSPQSSRHIKLNVIRDGNSFTITCTFPLILSEKLIAAVPSNDELEKKQVLRLTIGFYTAYEANKTIAPSTSTAIDSDENQQTSPTSSGLFQQLMLSLSIQLINSTEKELMNKIPNFRTMENEILRQKSDETGQFQLDEASNVADKIQPTKLLPLVSSTEEVLVFTAEPEAASAVNFDDNKAEGNLQKGISPMRQEMESTIFQDEREDIGK
ncbi:PREDICTED: uncharacterized protein LOC109592940, partial [Amphimedon queenslandica]|uniref:Uncharacterized protein n=2 Tax=Amphimedon queenslandica TaxID=400682 RepID=A0AAN0K3C6_AMPQE